MKLFLSLFSLFSKSAACRPYQFYRFGLQVLLGLAFSKLMSLPVNAAEKVYFSYGLLERSVSLASLESYAKAGVVNSDLAFFLNFLDSETEDEFHTALNTSYRISPVVVSQVFYEPMGERALSYVGNLIQTGQRLNGLYAMRSALILAAVQPEGFTLVDVLRHYPTEGMRINLEEALRALRRGERFFDDTNAVIAGIEQLAAQSESSRAIDPTDLPDLRQPGSLPFSKQTIVLTDASRRRTYPVDLYLPQHLFQDQTLAGTVPVAVLSHGLGASRVDFSEIAEYFAAYGFAVVLPEHIGSNTDLKEAVLAGRASEVFRVSEFVDRPLDIQFVLDELEQRNQNEWQNRLNLQQVAAMGHSFGGYTVLALGGATVDFDHLQQECSQTQFLDFLDPALLLQCRALESSPAAKARLTEGLSDRRVGLVVAVNPVNASIFGRQGLSQVQVPTVIGASGYDPATPLVAEQAYSFTWLTTPQRYLLLARGGSHTPQLTATINRMLSPSFDSEQLAEEVALFRSNLRALLLAFLQVYLGGYTEYERYLQPFQVRTLGDPPFEFSLIRSLTEEQLLQMLD